MKQELIATARGYIGTPFHHQGRLKKTAHIRGGIDCLGLLICTARDLSLKAKDGSYFADHDMLHYLHQPDTQALRNTLDKLLYRLALPQIDVADIGLFAIDGQPQHMGIMTDIGLLHAYAPARKVVEHPFDTYWQSKLIAAYRVGSSI